MVFCVSKFTDAGGATELLASMPMPKRWHLLLTASCCVWRAAPVAPQGIFNDGAYVAFSGDSTSEANIPTDVREKQHMFEKHGSVMQLLEDTFSTSSFYYRNQRPLYEAAAKMYRVNWCWAQTEGIHSLDISSQYLMMLRMHSMGNLLTKFSRDDFRIEKDKRAMNAFFKRNSLPVSAVVGDWYTKADLVADLNSLRAYENVKIWPSFFKANHVHGGAGGSSGVMRVKSKAYVESVEGRAAVMKWVEDVWGLKSDDSRRPWREAGNKLTSRVENGVRSTALFASNVQFCRSIRPNRAGFQF